MTEKDYNLKFLDFQPADDADGAKFLGNEGDTSLLDSYSRTVVNVVNRVGPAVVHIRITRPSRTRPGASPREVGGSGSGFILTVIPSPTATSSRKRAILKSA